MQRNLSYKNFITYSILSFLFAVYTALGTMYLFLPPLLSVLFFIYRRAVRKDDVLQLFFIIGNILIFEAEKGFLAFTLLIYFMLLDKFVVPKIEQTINQLFLKNFLYVSIAYIGYFFFSILIGQIFLIPSINIDFYTVYYIVFEFFVVSIFL